MEYKSPDGNTREVPLKPWYVRAKEIMRQKRVTGTELAKVIGVTQGTMSLKLNGHRSTEVGEIIDIAKYLGVSVSQLCDGESDVISKVDERALLNLYRQMTDKERELAIRLVQTIK